jgi:nicotinate-nucleotide pyrophosphorylase (carboxylating)
MLDKYAVSAGGGRNHRRALGDGILIKDNHIAALRADGVGICDVVKRARALAPHTVKIEVEVNTLDEVREALRGGADVLLFDNMPVPRMHEAARIVGDQALTEASGGIDLDTVSEVAATGVDLISVGALTHSASALDISLEYED